MAVVLIACPGDDDDDDVGDDGEQYNVSSNSESEQTTSPVS